MRFKLGIIAAICASVLACPSARAGAVYSIQPSTLLVAPGDVGDSFNVVLTNTGPDSISVAAFALEVTVSDPDITLVGADYATADPYIFTGDSFDQDNAALIESICSCSYTLSFPGIDTTAQTLEASDVTNDTANVTIASGESIGLADVLFDVAADATPGPFTLAFTGSSSVADSNSLSDASGDAISIDTFSGATGTVAAATPEPGTALLFGGALSILGLLRRKR